MRRVERGRRVPVARAIALAVAASALGASGAVALGGSAFNARLGGGGATAGMAQCFATPSGGVTCEPALPPAGRCSVRGMPGQAFRGIALGATGRARGVRTCYIERDGGGIPTLRGGETWAYRGSPGVTCRSLRRGGGTAAPLVVTCRNRTRYGFTISAPGRMVPFTPPAKKHSTARSAVAPENLVPSNTPEARFGRFTQDGGPDAPHLIRAFGPPDVVRETESGCFMRWRAIGATVSLTTFGNGTSACQEGTFIQAWLNGPQWRTQFGVGPGVSAHAAARRALRPCRKSWECGGPGRRGYVYRTDRSDCGAGRSVTLAGEVRKGRVVALVVMWHGCE